MSDRPGLNRRHFMSHLAGLSAMALPGMQFWHGLRAAEGELKKANKSLIVLWMGGGPSHMDLWDLKPGAATGGDFKPIKTSASGVEISEVLPTVAKQMKHLSIVRSLVTNEGSHERGTELMNTGRAPNPVVQYPAIGATASSLLTDKNLALPGFVGIGGTAQRIGPGFLGSAYSPFTVQNAGQRPQNIDPPKEIGSGALAEERIRRRQRLFYAVEDRFQGSLFPRASAEDRKGAEDPSAAHAGMYRKGFDLTVSKLRTVFEVANENPKTIEMYGGRQNQFGMGCLLARKLVEAGVTAVEIDLGGWDNHGNIFPTIRTGNGPRLDKGMGALVEDLAQRGKLKDTVVVWMGEFGRTPRINQNAGRDHWARCWSVVVGGGSLKGGQTFGGTSADGMDVDTSKGPSATIGDLFATIFKGLGLDPETKVRDNLGRPLSIADGKPLTGLV